MPSQLHEFLIELFRNRPGLAPSLLRDALRVELPAYTEARIDSAELNEVQPTEYRADLVVLLVDGVPVYGIVVEVQLAPDERKQYVWPVYVTGLRARMRCPVCLFVVAADDACARWAAKPINIGGGTIMTPTVLRPSGVPVVTDEAVAMADPELAVLSAIAHGQDADIEKVVRIASAAQGASRNLDSDRGKLYVDLVYFSISEVARRALHAVDISKYQYQSDFAKRFIAEGQAEGRAEGKAEGKNEGIEIGRVEGRVAAISQVLTARFGVLGEEIRMRLATSSLEQLDAICGRLLTARTLEEALGQPGPISTATAPQPMAPPAATN